MTKNLFCALMSGTVLAHCLLFASLSPALAGQTVTIDANVPGGVSGNNDPPYPVAWPPGPSNLLDPNNNTVIVNSGIVSGDVDGADALATGLDPATATGNRVIMNGGRVDWDVYGAYAESDSGNATATGNSVTINGGAVTGDVYGGSAQSDSGNATATGNRVIINNGTITGDVYGGSASSSGGGDAAAMGNSVTINNGTITGDVYGGYATGNGGSLTATHNTVTISGSPTFNNPAGTILYGGVTSPVGGDAFTGNTLNVWNYSGSSVNELKNFHYYNFILPASLSGLNVIKPVVFVGPGGLISTVTGVSVMGGGRAPQIGESISLINITNAAGDGFGDTGEGPVNVIRNNNNILAGKKGATLNALFRLDQQDRTLVAVVEGMRAAPEAKALSEGFLSGVALVNQGADLIAGKGIGQALNSAGQKGYGLGSFAAVSGGWSKYNTGSHVDMSSLNLIAGLSFGADLPPGRLTLGAFFEWGNGSYNTYNSFSRTPDVNGDGTAYYIGGGILGRMDFIDTGPGNFYTEASFRAGGLHNDYRTSDLRDAMGNSARGYDSFSAYYGIHAGLGYVWRFTEQASLDLHAKYFWTRQQGDKVTLATDDPVKFKDMDSHRLRLGARFSYVINEHVSPYIGAAYEHEFDGRQRATTYGYPIDEPSLRGGTGIGELGLTLKPSKTLPLSFDLGVQGYVGKREGVTGSLQVCFEF